MSSGSTFVLYRKYNQKMATDEFKAVIDSYVKTNKDQDYSVEKKFDEEYAKDIPLVMSLRHGHESSKYDKETKEWIDTRDHSIDGQRNNFKYVLKTDASHLDKLLEWDFTSSFTCLKSEWNLNAYNYKDNMHMIDKSTAADMLQACNYLLSKNWSDEFEDVLNNKWINVFAKGNDCAEYWQYVYRNNKKRLKEILEDEYEAFSAEWQIKHLRTILSTFVNAEEDYSDDKTELILVYSAW